MPDFHYRIQLINAVVIDNWIKRTMVDGSISGILHNRVIGV